ncbi:uncharacterized protein TNCV_759131 [Trichonephila clavipes]|nr:uncharacterized protein TNCV_759131 [Trichonephila clavipes]
MGAVISNVLQPGVFIWFKKTQGVLVKMLPVPGWRPMQQLAESVNFLRCGGLLDDSSVESVLSLCNPNYGSIARMPQPAERVSTPPSPHCGNSASSRQYVINVGGFSSAFTLMRLRAKTVFCFWLHATTASLTVRCPQRYFHGDQRRI